MLVLLTWAIVGSTLTLFSRSTNCVLPRWIFVTVRIIVVAVVVIALVLVRSCSCSVLVVFVVLLYFLLSFS
jgi:hypothetical protein